MLKVYGFSRVNEFARGNTRDLRVLSQNKNIPDVIRQTAYRLYLKRSSG